MPSKLFYLAISCLFVVPTLLRGDDELEKRATWNPVPVPQVKQQLDEWLATLSLDEKANNQVAALWEANHLPASGPEALERLATTAAVADPAIRELALFCHAERTSPVLPKFAALSDERLPAFVRNNLRLLFARWLAQNNLYDEALEQLGDLQPVDVVDPASLLFYKSVAHHRLLDKDQFVPAISKLMENEAAIPRRYQTLAKLMAADIQPLKKDSLDEVARMMDDIRRRLDLGRAGAKVRKEEDDVIAKLDKMIEELEEQQKQQEQQQQQQQQQSQGSKNPSQAKPDSTPGGIKGQGDVDLKNIGNKSGWGNLPPKERQETLQQISKDLPAHFRETIEEYFRKLAREGGKK